MCFLKNRILSLILFLAAAFSCQVQAQPIQSDSPLSKLIQYRDEIQTVVKQGDEDALRDLVSKIRVASAEAGFEDLDMISKELQSRAVITAFQGDTEFASQVLDAAYALSPTSVTFLMDAASLRSRLLDKNTLGELVRALPNLRGTEVLTFVHAVLPILGWASVFGVLTLLFCALLFSIPEYFSEEKNKSLQKILSACLIAAVLLPALYLGPLWTLFSWGSALVLIQKRYAMLSLLAGAVLCFWVVCQEIQEQHEIWRADHPLQAATALVESKLTTLPSSMVHVRANEKQQQLFLLASARIYRMGGNVSEAISRITALRDRYPDDVLYKKEHALLLALEGKYAKADALYTEAIGGKYLSSMELLNHSKIKYALTEVSNGERLFSLARERNPELVLSQQEIESLDGIQPMRVWHWPPAPISAGFLSSIYALKDTGFFSAPLIAMGGATRSIAFMLGITICALSVLLADNSKNSQKVRQFQSQWPLLWLCVRAVPGGMFVARYAIVPALIAAIIFYVGVCLWLGWPKHLTEFVVFYPDSALYGAILAIVTGVSLVVLGNLSLPPVKMSSDAQQDPSSRTLLAIFFLSVCIIPVLFWTDMLRPL